MLPETTRFDAARPARDAADPPRAPAALAIACATVLIHVLLNRGYGVFRDEFYYLACARHPAWGYVDHPPMIALVAGASRMFGDSISALRLFPALAHGALVLLAARMARRLGGGAWAQGLAALAVLIGPIFLASGNVLTMNPFEQVAWSACVLAVIEAIRRDRISAWLGVAAAAGLGLLTKHSTAFLLAALFMALLLTPERRLLRGRGPWLALALAFVMVAPNLVWQMQHGWPTLEFLRNVTTHKNAAVPPLEFLAAQAILMHPINLPLFLAGLWHFFFSAPGRRFRVFGWTWLILLVMFLVTHGKHYYLAPIDPIVLAGGAVAFERALAHGMVGALRPVLAGLMLVAGVLAAPLTLPMLPPPVFVRYAAAVGFKEPAAERHRPARLPQLYADMFGWKEMVDEVAQVWNALTPEERGRCAIFASNYGEAGAIDYFGPRLGLPPASSGHNSYWLWGLATPHADLVITVGESPEDVAESFERVEVVRVFHHPWNMPYESDLPICIGRKPRMTWEEIWPHTKKFI